MSAHGDQRNLGRLVMRLQLVSRQFKEVAELVGALSGETKTLAQQTLWHPAGVELDVNRVLVVKERLGQLLVAIKLEHEKVREELFAMGQQEGVPESD